MTIAYLVSKYPAPSHTFIRREIGALRRAGLRVETYSIRPGESLAEPDQSEQARTFNVLPAGAAALSVDLLRALARRPRRFAATLFATLAHRLPGARQRLRTLAYFVEAMRLAIRLERDGITHLHNHFSNPAASVGLAASRYLGIGWSVTLHGLTDFGGPTTPLLARKVQAARFVVCVTDRGRDEVMRLTPPSMWHKVHVVRCGIDPGSLPEAARRPPGLGRPIEFLSVGRLSPEKAQLGLVEALGRIVAQGLDVRLTLIGGGPMENDLRAVIAERRLEDRVVLMGQQPEAVVLDAMARADAFVLSSLMEGLPVVLMEALAVELPVIAPNVGGIAELVVHRETGLLFTAGRWDELADRMADLARDPELGAKMARAGKARVLSDFDVTRAAEPLVALFAGAGA